MPGTNTEFTNLLGHVIRDLTTPQFTDSLVALMRARISFDYTVMFGYCGEARPLVLFDNFPRSKRRIFVSQYQDGPYLLDPFFLACGHEMDDGLYRMKQLAPDRFYQSEYFRSYYVQTGLAEEIGYFVSLPGDTRVVISLMRANSSTAFNAREFKALQQIEPVVTAAAQKQWHELEIKFSRGTKTDTRSGIQQSIEHAFHTFGKSILTPRERDVVEYVLKGHSSEAIAQILEISSGTVRIHRKNIYAKLRINSQGELFSRFISALS